MSQDFSGGPGADQSWTSRAYSWFKRPWGMRSRVWYSTGVTAVCALVGTVLAVATSAGSSSLVGIFVLSLGAGAVSLPLTYLFSQRDKSPLLRGYTVAGMTGVAVLTGGAVSLFIVDPATFFNMANAVGLNLPSFLAVTAAVPVGGALVIGTTHKIIDIRRGGGERLPLVQHDSNELPLVSGSNVFGTNAKLLGSLGVAGGLSFVVEQTSEIVVGGILNRVQDGNLVRFAQLDVGSIAVVMVGTAAFIIINGPERVIENINYVLNRHELRAENGGLDESIATRENEAAVQTYTSADEDDATTMGKQPAG